VKIRSALFETADVSQYSPNRFEFEKTVKKFLEKSADEAHDLLEQFEEKIPSNDQLTAGISLFYFEESFDEV
jgi:hypothetical protein